MSSLCGGLREFAMRYALGGLRFTMSSLCGGLREFTMASVSYAVASVSSNAVASVSSLCSGLREFTMQWPP